MGFHYASTHTGLRDRALLGILAYTLARIGAVVNALKLKRKTAKRRSSRFTTSSKSFLTSETDPQQLNTFLTRTGGFSRDGLISWSRVPSIAPSRLELAYNGGPSYELIDSNLRAGNPVIALVPLPDGGYHFVVIWGRKVGTT
jgi:hypothetical protein